MEIQFVFLFVFCSRRNTKFPEVKAGGLQTRTCDEAYRETRETYRTVCRDGKKPLSRDSKNTATQKNGMRYKQGKATVKSIAGGIQRNNMHSRIAN